MSLATFDELRTALARGLVEPVYLVLGPEEYLRRETVRHIRERTVAAETRAFNYDEFSASQTVAATVLSAARTYPMMAQRRVVLVSEVDRASDPDREEYIQYARSPEPKAVLILTAEDLDRRTAFYRVFRDHACAIECPPLKGAALERWIAEYFRSRSGRISAAAVRSLIDRAGSQLQDLVTEAEKLLAYAGAAGEVSEASISELVRSDRQRDIFDLTDALGRRDPQGALKILGRLIEGDERPAGILAMLARHLRQVLIVRELSARGLNSREITNAAQIPRFLAEQFIRQARGLDTKHIDQLYRRVAEVDLRLKSTGLDGRMLLEILICAFGTGPAPPARSPN